MISPTLINNLVGFFIINVILKDTIDAIPSLKQNIEGLVPFLSRLSVLVFENDSFDGSCEAFRMGL
jgi:hypothetical protein